MLRDIALWDTPASLSKGHVSGRNNEIRLFLPVFICKIIHVATGTSDVVHYFLSIRREA